MSETLTETPKIAPAKQSGLSVVVLVFIVGAALSPFGSWLWRYLTDQVVCTAMSIGAGLEAYVRNLAGVPY